MSLLAMSIGLALAAPAPAQVVIAPGTNIGAYLNTNLSATNNNFVLGGDAVWNTSVPQTAARAQLTLDGGGYTITTGGITNSFLHPSSSVTPTTSVISNVTFQGTPSSVYPLFYYSGTNGYTGNFSLNDVRFNNFTGGSGIEGSVVYMNVSSTTASTLNFSAGGANGLIFSNNVGAGDAAGAVAMYVGTMNFFGPVLFDSNVTGNYGGALSMYQGQGLVNFNGPVTFNNNRATNYFGGAIDLWGGDSRLNFNAPTLFSGNYVSSSATGAGDPRGGAINIGYLSPGSGATIVQFNDVTTFDGNYILSTGTNGNARGGAISAFGNGASYDYRYVFTAPAIFRSNYAGKTGGGSGGGYGGAIFYDSAAASVSLTSGTRFENNYASTSGGAIYLQSGTITLNALTDNIVFQGNRQGVTFSGGLPVAGTGVPNGIYLGLSGNLNFNAEAGQQIHLYDPISSTVGSTVTVTKSGNGEVILYGDNGATTLFDSTIRANTTVQGGNFTLADGVNYGVNTAGTFLVNTGGGTSGTVRGGGGSTLRAQTITISGAGAARANGGLFTLDAPTINFQNASSFGGNGTLAATSNMILSGTVLANVGIGEELDVTGRLTGAGGLTVYGGGTLLLSNASEAYTGATTVSADTTLVGGVANAFDDSSAMTVNGILDLGRNNLDQIARNLAGAGTGRLLLGSATLTANTSAATTYAGTIEGSGTFVKSGTGNLRLTGVANTYSGGTTIVPGGGTLTVTNGGALGTGTVSNEATLQFDFADDSVVQNLLTGTGFLGKSGAGKTTLTAAGSSAGAVTVSAGTLDFQQDGVFSASSLLTLGGATTQIGANAQLVMSGAFGQSAGATLNVDVGAANPPLITAGSATLNGTLNVTGFAGALPPLASLLPSTQYTIIQTTGGGLTGNFSSFTGTGASPFDFVTIIGQVSGTDYTVGYGLRWLGGATGGDGTFTLTDPDDLFEVDLALGNQVASSTGWNGQTLTKNGAGTLVLSADNTYSGPTLINAGTLQLGNGGTAGSIIGDVTNNGALVFDRSNPQLFAGAISGTGAVSQSGTSTLTLTGQNTYTGGTTIASGALQIGAGGTTGSIVGDVINEGALVFNRSDTLTYDGAISGSGAVFQAGPGTTVLTGQSTHSGGTTIAEGTLQIGAGGTTGSIIGDVANDGMLSFNRSDQLDFAGTVSGSGALTQSGTGTTVLTGANTYTGGTTIAAGTLQLGDGGTSGAIVGNVLNDGVLAFDRSDAIAFGGVVSGSGGLVHLGSGTTTLTAANTYAGGTTITAGMLQIGDGGTTGSIIGNVANEGVLAFNRADTLSFTGSISGNGAVEQIGAGLTVFTGSNTYTGGTSISAGTLQLGAGGTTGSILGDVLNNGQLVVDRSDVLALGGVIGGSGSFTQAGTGTTVLSGDSTYSGGTTIANGTLVLGNGGSSGSIVGDVANEGALVFDRSDTLEFDGTVSGTGRLLQSGTGVTVLTATHTYTGGTTISGGTLQLGNGGTTGAIVGDVLNDGVFRFNRADSLTFAGIVSGTGALIQDGGGGSVLTLTGNNSYTGGTTIAAGVLQVGDGGTTGAIVGDVDNGGTLIFNRSDAVTFGGTIGGTGTLTQQGTGTLTLTGDNSYAGGTSIANGTLRIGNGGTTGSLGSGDVSNAGVLVFDRADTYTYAGSILGGGTIRQAGTGTTVLTGDSSTASGSIEVSAGRLLVNGSLGDAGSTTTVSSGAILGGSGTLGGDVVVTGGTLAPGNSPGTLTIAGDLVLDGASVLEYELGEAGAVGGAFNDLTVVGGDLVLDGTLNVAVSAGGTFGAGVYRIINYAGSLTDNGLTLGSMPAGSVTSIQTGFAGQVNLVNTAGLTLNYWDGNGPKFDGVINGGDGVWQASAGNDNWTESTGALNAAYTDEAFSIFAGAAGVVTVDTSLGAIQSSGMQFAVDGYVVQGAAITLLEGSNTLRVGDGTAGGSAYVATIGSELTGTGGIDKTDLGTLVLAGTNSYTGGTAVSAGTLQLGNGGTSGSILGDAVVDGTLAFNRSDTWTFAGSISGTGSVVQAGTGTTVLTADSTHAGGTVISAGALQLGDGGTSGSVTGQITNNGSLVFNRSDAWTFAGAIGGSGSATQAGTGTTVLAGDNTYTGGTTIAAGTLQIGDGGSTGTLSGNVLNNATLRFARADGLAFTGAISGTGAVVQAGAGTTVLTGASTYTGGTTISAGRLQLGDGGSSGSIVGDVANDGVLAFNRADTATFAGTISGTGALVQTGSGTTVLTGASTYGGGTTVVAGTLQLGDGGTAGSIVGDVVNNATLAFNRSDVTVFDGTISGSGALTQIGAGTTVLTADNTYGGGTTIAAGTLRLGAGGTSGSILGDVVDNGTLAFDRSDALTFAGRISGSGTLVQAGTGTTTLTGENTYSGGTTISAGALRIGDGGATGSITGNVANDSVLIFDRADTLAFAGQISGSGQVRQAGGGTTVLTGANTYAGGTEIDAGTLQIGDGGTVGSITGDVVNDGVLAFHRSDTWIFTGAISGTGQLRQVGSGTTALTGVATHTGGTTIAAGTLQVGAGGTSGSLAGDVANQGRLAFDRSDAVVFGGVVSGTGTLAQVGTGTTTLTGANTYTGGTTVSAGTLRIGDGGTSGSIVGDVANYGTLVFDRSDARLFAGTVSGSGALVQAGAGTTTLTGTHSYSGGTVISGGALQLGDGGSSGSIIGNVVNDGVLIFNRADLLALDGSISGAGTIRQLGGGITVLSGDSSAFTGSTVVGSGTLRIDGILGASASAMDVVTGGTLGGRGTIGGDVAVDDGIFAPGASVGTLTIGGDLSFTGASVLVFEFGQAGVEGGSFNDLAIVRGDLVLDGRLDVTTSASGTFGPGIYRIIRYDGTLTDNGLTLGTVPAGSVDFIQTGFAGQVNLVNTAGLVLDYWDGVGPPQNGTIDGGDGIWQASGGNSKWSESSGTINAPFTDSAFAIFAAAPGTVTVDNSVGTVVTSGMQFAVDGYAVQGDALTLAPGQQFIRVGDGTTTGSDYIATLSSQLVGTGGVSKGDAGTLVLSGENSYSGGTTITAGTLQLGDGGTSGSIVGDVQNQGVLRFDRADALTFDGLISGAGAVVQAGSGTTILTADNSYLGGTRIAAGALQLGDGGTGGSILGEVVNEGLLVLDRSDDTAFLGTITGAGSLRKQGPNTTLLAGLNTYAGGTVIQAGTLTGSATSFGSGSIENAAALVIDQPTAARFANAINGTGTFTKTGAGALDLVGTHGLTGATTVAGGLLAVNGSLAGSAVRVLADGTLGGTGTVGTTTLVEGATLTPGNSIGTLTVNGDFSQAAGTTYRVEVDPGSTASDRVQVSGTATLEGNPFLYVVKATPGEYTMNSRYTVLTAAGGLTGTYALTGEITGAFYELVDSYDANNAYLTPVRVRRFPDAAITPNEIATAAGLESLPDGHPAKDAVGLLPDDASARQAFNQLSGEIHATARTQMLHDSRFVREAAVDRVRQALCAVGAADPRVGTRPANEPATEATCAPEHPIMWARVHGSRGTFDGDGNAAEADRRISGVFIGSDVPLDQWNLGVMAGYSGADLDVDDRNSSGQIDGYSLALYGGSQWGALGLRWVVGHTWQDVEVRRDVVFPGYIEPLEGDYHARTVQALGEVGYRVELRRLALEPFLSMAYVQQSSDDFAERGDYSALRGRSDSQSVILSTLGTRAAVEFGEGDAHWKLRGMLGWRHASSATVPTTVMSFSGSIPMTIAGVPLDRDVGVVEMGVEGRIARNFLLGVSYSGQFGSDLRDNGVSVGMTWTF